MNNYTTSKLDGEMVLRFTTLMRVQHFILFVTLIVLSLTGFALKYHDTWFGGALIQIEGGIEARGIFHRAAAILLMILAVYHSWWVVMTDEGHRGLMVLKVKLTDLQKFIA